VRAQRTGAQAPRGGEGPERERCKKENSTESVLIRRRDGGEGAGDEMKGKWRREATREQIAIGGGERSGITTWTREYR